MGTNFKLCCGQLRIWSYTNNDKIEASPGTGEISPKSKSDPLKDHFYEKQHRKDQIDNFEDKHQLFIVLKKKSKQRT